MGDDHKGLSDSSSESHDSACTEANGNSDNAKWNVLFFGNVCDWLTVVDKKIHCYKTLIHSILEYSFHTLKNLKKLEAVNEELLDTPFLKPLP